MEGYEDFFSAHLLPEILRRLDTRGEQRFDVVRLGDGDGPMSQNRLDRSIPNFKLVEDLPRVLCEKRAIRTTVFLS